MATQLSNVDLPSSSSVEDEMPAFRAEIDCLKSLMESISKHPLVLAL